MQAGFPEEEEHEGYPRWLRDALEHEEAAAPPGTEPEGEPPGVEPSPRSSVPPSGRQRFLGLDLSWRGRHEVHCQVRLGRDTDEITGSAAGNDVPALRARIAARATLDALRQTLPRTADLQLRDAQIVSALAGHVVVVGVYGLTEGGVRALTGVSPVEDTVERSAVLATLQATNRWLSAPDRDSGRGQSG